jgi:hypothetical protein
LDEEAQNRAMSEATVTIRYDGPLLEFHQMDIADIAPALLGISELCKIANRKFNGERAAVKVLIGTDAEHKCFQLDLHVVQTIWEHTKTILSSEDVKTAKDFLDWLGLIGSAVGAPLGLFQLLKKLGNKKIDSTTIETKTGRDVVQITVEGDHNHITVYPQALDLLRDEAAISNAKKVVLPLIQDGYTKVEFESNKRVTETIVRDDAISIASILPSQIETPHKDEPQVLTAWVTVYAPVFDSKAPKWRFRFGGAHEYMDIRETEIAPLAMKRGGAFVDDAYKVELEITQEHKPAGGITNHYKIRRVLDFRPARVPYQADAFMEHKPAEDDDFGEITDER